MKSSGGWIKIHRQIMDTPEWLAEPFTRGQAWVDLLLLANHAPGYIRKRGILVAVDRGMVGFSEDALAERWQWSKGKVRRFIAELTRLSRVSRKSSEKTELKNTSVSNLIYIINYDKYQLSNTEDSTENGPKTTTEQERKEKKVKTPVEILEIISALKSRYPDQKIINQALAVISSTRKTNHISVNVEFSILKSWDRHPVESVLSGIRIYLSKGFAAEGKDEKYLIGIIRNEKPRLAAPKATPVWY